MVVMYVMQYLLFEVTLAAAQLQARPEHLMALVVQGRRPESLLV